MPQHRLPVMLLRNLDPANGHCNGSCYVVKSLHRHLIVAIVATGVHAGKELFIPQIPIAPSDNVFPFQMQRCQFPIRLCFGMTANKAQGQTLKEVGIYLRKDFFSHGQLYVSISRVGDPTKVKVYSKNGKYEGNEGSGVFINNVVFNEVL